MKQSWALFKGIVMFLDLVNRYLLHLGSYRMKKIQDIQVVTKVFWDTFNMCDGAQRRANFTVSALALTLSRSRHKSQLLPSRSYTGTYRVWCGRSRSWGLVPRFRLRRKHQSCPIASQPARREPAPPRARRRPHSPRRATAADDAILDFKLTAVTRDVKSSLALRLAPLPPFWLESNGQFLKVWTVTTGFLSLVVARHYGFSVTR